ncbi:MAG: glycosyltransferase family 1 protein [Patescibacteria group bacterium]|nr:glycosyltransferase family 1 protein [Patescibacteria group bacterium]
MEKKKFKIGIDARLYQIPGGIGRYCRELINGLEKVSASSADRDDQNEYYIFLNKEGYGLYNPSQPNFHKVMANVGWYGFSEQLKMPGIWNSVKPDLMHFTHFNKSIFYRRCPYVVTIHDLTYSIVAKEGMKISKLPPLIFEIKQFVYERVIKDVIKKARRIIVPSYNSKKDIISAYKIKGDKVAVTYESVDASFSPDEKRETFKDLNNRFGIMKENYFIYVGNASPHKNLKRLILAFDILAKEKKDFQLVLAGKKEKFYKALEEWVAKDGIGDGRIIFTGVVTDDELQALLANSYACTFPSLAEGFGIPPLEAMSSGTPILTSATSCLPEVCENAAIYFNPYLPESIAEKMKMIIENPKMREDFIKAGLNHIKKFSWEKMAEETREVYMSVLKKE